jgi:putative flippase GtrA
MPIWQRKESEKIMAKEKNRELIRTVKFVLFSISAGVIQILSFTLLNELMTWPYWPSYLIAITLSVLWNFTLNRRFTFKSANNVPIAMAQTAAFYLVFTPLSTLLGNYLVENLQWNEYLVTILNMLSNFVLEYLFQRFVVFRNSLDTNDLAKKEQNTN